MQTSCSCKSFISSVHQNCRWNKTVILNKTLHMPLWLSRLYCICT